MKKPISILLVEDDANFGLVLRDYLKMNKYDVEWAQTGELGYNLLRKNSYSLCILDVMMPDMDGFTLASKIGDLHLSMPFIFLTAKSLKEDIIKGYQLGAIDYLTKPFDPEILLLKIEAIVGAHSDSQSKTLEKYDFNQFSLQPNIRQLNYPNGESEVLSPKETSVLIKLLEYQNKLLHRDVILSAVWNDINYFTSRSLDVYINKLRKRFENTSQISIQNIRGEGFIMHIK